jgi:hypothetical protein
MKKKIIGLIVCLLLITIPVLSATETIIDDKNNSNLSDEYQNLKQQTIGSSTYFENWTEQDKLIATDGENGDNFGDSVSIDGNYLIVGAPYDGRYSTGAAYIFKRDGSTWVEEEKLIASDAEDGDFFGYSVSIDGTYALVGAYGDNSGTGAAYIFKRDGSTWIEEQKLTASDGEAGDNFGYSVSIDDTFAIIGAYSDDSHTGSVYVFNFSGAVWIEEYKLIAFDSTPGDCFGSSVSKDGNFVIIGAYGDDDYSGSAYILEHCCYWKWREKVNTSSGLPYFGWSVCIQGDYAIVGAPGAPAGDSTGSAYIYKRDDNSWNEQTYWNGENPGDYFGISVSIDRSYSVVGAYGNNDGTGSAYIFNRSGTTWIEEQKITASDGEADDYFGCSVSIYAGYAVIGAYGDDSSTGSAYVFFNSGIPDLSIEITGGLGVNAKIINNGDNDAKDIDIEINVVGGLFGLINKQAYDTIDVLAGESKTVSTGLIFGLGKINIIVKTNFEEKTVEGTQIIIFTTIKS